MKTLHLSDRDAKALLGFLKQQREDAEYIYAPHFRAFTHIIDKLELAIKYHCPRFRTTKAGSNRSQHGLADKWTEDTTNHSSSTRPV